MNRLDADSTHDFLARFYSFGDSLLRRVEISYASSNNRTVAMLLAARDSKELQDDGWVSVRIIISQVKDYCFSDTFRTSTQVLSNGIHVCWFDNIVGFDISHFADPPKSLDELKQSRFFLTGMKVDWTVEPY